jgi:hypothetical protein
MPLIDHPTGHYRFLPGIAPYSCGVVAQSGYEIVHATLHDPMPYRQGFERIERYLEGLGRPRGALCGVELRTPRPWTFEGFGAFNAQYLGVLSGWSLHVEGMNPVARTNVAPEIDPPPEPLLFGFSYTQPSDRAEELTFVVAGAGEVLDGRLSPDAVVWGSDTSAESLAHKGSYVMDVMEARLRGLGGDWPQVTAVDIYTVHPIYHLLPDIILRRIGGAAGRGVHWYYSRPPVEGIEFEMDLRGVTSEVRLR